MINDASCVNGMVKGGGGDYSLLQWDFFSMLDFEILCIYHMGL